MSVRSRARWEWRDAWLNEITALRIPIGDRQRRALAVYALCDVLRDESGDGTPVGQASTKTIAGLLTVRHRDTATKIIAELEALGAIIVKRSGRHSGGPNTYYGRLPIGSHRDKLDD
jgi:hypothetical protein